MDGYGNGQTTDCKRKSKIQGGKEEREGAKTLVSLVIVFILNVSAHTQNVLCKMCCNS